LIWVKRVIWLVLAVFSATIIAVVFSGGLVDDSRRKETGLAPANGAAVPSEQRAASPGSGAGPPAGSMAYDRYLPGGRQSPPEPSPEVGP